MRVNRVWNDRDHELHVSARILRHVPMTFLVDIFARGRNGEVQATEIASDAFGHRILKNGVGTCGRGVKKMRTGFRLLRIGFR